MVHNTAYAGDSLFRQNPNTRLHKVITEVVTFPSRLSSGLSMARCTLPATQGVPSPRARQMGGLQHGT
eukprot:32681-Pyramimonas_sp.AAC.2